jgi:hypothetical protein
MSPEEIKAAVEELLGHAQSEYRSSVQNHLETILKINSELDGVHPAEMGESLTRIFDLSQDIPMGFMNRGATRADIQQKLCAELTKTIDTFEELQPKNFASKSISYMARSLTMPLNLRDNLKLQLPKLYAMGNFRDIDQSLHNILQAKVKLLSTYLGVISALNFYEDMFTSEVVQGHNLTMLSRHEVCTNLSKSFGFSPDTDLTAKKPSFFDIYVQSRLELFSAKVVKETMAAFINNLYAKSFFIGAISSPVSRAISTATDAGLGCEIVDHFHVSHRFSEQKISSKTPSLALFSPYVTSGTESSTPSQIEMRLRGERYRSVTVSNFTRQASINSTQESARAYRTRVQEATSMLVPNEVNVRQNNLTWVFAHGDLLQDVAEELSGRPMVKLGYGDTYLFSGVGDGLRLVGVMNRFGVCKPPPQQEHTVVDAPSNEAPVFN